MFANTRLLARLIFSAALIFVLGFSALRAQDSALEEIKYKEDYDRLERIKKVTDVAKRGDQFVSFFRERPDMDFKLRDYADSLFVRDLDSLLKQQNFAAIKSLCDRALKARPKFGEAYLYQGVALKNDKKVAEAMMSFARGAGLENPLQKKSKQQLDLVYRQAHGSLIGEDKFIKEAVKDLK
jgi:hypothetical protein